MKNEPEEQREQHQNPQQPPAQQQQQQTQQQTRSATLPQMNRAPKVEPLHPEPSPSGEDDVVLFSLDDSTTKYKPLTLSSTPYKGLSQDSLTSDGKYINKWGQRYPGSANSTADIEANCLIHLAQNFEVGPGVPTIAVTVPPAMAIITRWIRDEHCFIIHFGNSSIEFASLSAACEKLRSSEGVKIVCSSPYAVPTKETGPFVEVSDVPRRFVAGYSVLMHYVGHSDAEKIGAIFTKIVELVQLQRSTFASQTSGRMSKTDEELVDSDAYQVDLNNTRLGIIIDREGGSGITMRIIDPINGEKAFTPDFDQDRITQYVSTVNDGEHKELSITAFYKPQVVPGEPPKSTILNRAWEANAGVHVFRNAIISPIMDPTCISPLGGLTNLLSFSPFGRSGVIGICVLLGRGESLKKLLEYWINVCLGTPTTWIDLCSPNQRQ